LLPEHPAHRDAARAAARDARARAESLAEALGGRLGAIVSVRDSRLGPPDPRPMMRMAAAAVEAMPIEAGELSVEAIVDVEFTFEQG
jgi:uncharacterized protein YggE